MNAPAKKGGLGWVVNLLIGAALLAAAVVSHAYLAVMHTALPIQVVAYGLEQARTNQHLQISRIAGSVSEGIRIKSVRWTGGGLTGVRVRSTGVRALLLQDEFTLHEVQIAKAWLDVSDWNQGATAALWPVRRFQIDRLTCRELVLTNRLTGFSAAIPALAWTGFMKADDQVELGRVTSDRFGGVLSVPEALAQVFYGRGYAQLTLAERNELDVKLSKFAGPRYRAPGTLK